MSKEKIKVLMTKEDKICDDCQQQLACVEVEDGECCGEKLISHLCTDCHINLQDNEQI